MKYLFRLIIFFLFIAGSVSLSQVTVAPVTVHLDDHNKNTYIIVRNNSNTSPWEVNIEMKFGYPKSDSSGNTFIYFPVNVSDEDPSAVKWINFYPRKFVLQPLEEQTVRIAAKPKQIKDGEYWGRPIITSKAVNNEDTASKETISVGLGVEFRTVIALNYRRGKVSTKINIDSLSGLFRDNKFILFTKLRREGNAAYIGNLCVNIYNEKDNKIKEIKQDISVYYELYKKIEIDAGSPANGKYTVEIQLNTDREETGGKIIKGNTATKKITINVN
jgi:P pilus assembly chaperone PapD